MDNYKHLAVEMLAPLQGLTAFLRRQKKQRKTAYFCGKYAVRPLGKTDTWTKK